MDSSRAAANVCGGPSVGFIYVSDYISEKSAQIGA
jgi:hypothetical protein